MLLLPVFACNGQGADITLFNILQMWFIGMCFCIHRKNSGGGGGGGGREREKGGQGRDHRREGGGETHQILQIRLCFYIHPLLMTGSRCDCAIDRVITGNSAIDSGFSLRPASSQGRDRHR